MKHSFYKKLKKVTVFSLLCILSITVFLLVYGNFSLKTTEFTISDSNIPTTFSGFKIAQISDLHNAQIGKNNRRLLSKLKAVQPDIIVITGDLVDSSHTDIPVAIDFAKAAVEIAPVYYVSGNHEAWLSENDFLTLKQSLSMAGVQILENEKTDIELNGEAITLIGVDDPDLQVSDDGFFFTDSVEMLASESDNYTVLLSHRPEYFDCYVNSGVNLTLSGHTHAGQIRLPFIGAMIAPGQGLFPEYDKGIFREKDTVMIVSAGLGNSVIPFRFLNNPELVIIELLQA